MPTKKLILLILDGWGLTATPQYAAMAHAPTPFIDALYKQYPYSRLAASGLAVGLPEGQVGNSEVGHLTIGAGRVVYQTLGKINQAIQSKALYQHPVLLAAFAYAKQQGKKVHLIGLASTGGVHSHLNHLKVLCSIAKDQSVTQLFIHAFTDGRDTDPHSAVSFLEAVEAHTQKTTGQLASIMGRYYAMDRDHRWERIQVAYDALVHGQGDQTPDWRQAIAQAYAQGITDEFLKPIVLTHDKGQPLACIEAGDVVLCFNFRPDRSRQLTQALTQTALPAYGMQPLPLYYLTLVTYQASFKNVHPLFDQLVLNHTLGEVLSRQGKKQLRIAETEKYPHVTYFFSGGREQAFPGEERIRCPSPPVATYDLQPAMGAFTIVEKVTAVLEQQHMDFICLNFANPDMVGHTGVWDAAVKACAIVDQCVAQVVTTALKNDYVALVTADHGNADTMRHATGRPHTAHTTHPVPCILIDTPHRKPLRKGTLADVAPTILQCMQLPIPKEMTGRSLMDT